MSLQPDVRITPELARFIGEVQKLEPADTGALYPYVRQAGYHGSRADQYALGRPNDYSIRSADDKAGPDDKCAAFDWISESARLRGDHAIMYRYGRRIRDAYNRRDPRLKGWREWLTYLDGALIGFDFVGWYTRIPDSSHDMHHHLSKVRRYAADWPTYAAMLSILAGEPLSVWQSGQSTYQEGEDVAVIDQADWDALKWRIEALTAGRDDVVAGPTAGEDVDLVRRVKALDAKVSALTAPALPAAEAIAAALLANPDFRALLVAAAREGAEVAEDS